MTAELPAGDSQTSPTRPDEEANEAAAEVAAPPTAVSSPDREAGEADIEGEPRAETQVEVEDEAGARPGDRPKRTTVEHVRSFADFLRFLVELEGELKTLPLEKNSPARKALWASVDFDNFADVIARIAERDFKLSTSVTLLVSADKFGLAGNARRNINELATRIVLGHRLFHTDDTLCESLYRLLSGDPDEEALSRALGRAQYLIKHAIDVERNRKPVPKAKIAAMAALAENAAQAVVLIAASAADWNVARCVEIFADKLWGAGGPVPESAAAREKLATLSKSARVTAALIVDSTRNRLRSAESERDHARTQMQVAQNQCRRLSQELAAARARSTEIESELNSRIAALQQESDARRKERMLVTSDFKRVRVDTARVIGQQVESLEDALGALENGDTDVTDEFVRHSIKHLKRSLSALRSAAEEDLQGKA
ncbi:hypothetical protein IRT45_15980 [Nocardia sp. BSTN01]|uniref:hypothetical protein n=1 Tax=Nocardia sp. BSTN01 TaxID=2783665 RepID=UPI00189069CB|nr:hypothetical protein [Nocardia sp. BSTN01]MBF4998650.1 hypothetical protein [Nocardia sp. BSTN01]